eukprot:gene212-biopygen3449
MRGRSFISGRVLLTITKDLLVDRKVAAVVARRKDEAASERRRPATTIPSDTFTFSRPLPSSRPRRRWRQVSEASLSATPPKPTGSRVGADYQVSRVQLGTWARGARRAALNETRYTVPSSARRLPGSARLPRRYRPRVRPPSRSPQGATTLASPCPRPHPQCWRHLPPLAVWTPANMGAREGGR